MNHNEDDPLLHFVGTQEAALDWDGSSPVFSTVGVGNLRPVGQTWTHTLHTAQNICPQRNGLERVALLPAVQAGSDPVLHSLAYRAASEFKSCIGKGSPTPQNTTHEACWQDMLPKLKSPFLKTCGSLSLELMQKHLTHAQSAFTVPCRFRCPAAEPQRIKPRFQLSCAPGPCSVFPESSRLYRPLELQPEGKGSHFPALRKNAADIQMGAG